MSLLNYPYIAATAKLRQLCPTLCDPIDGSPPGSPVSGILLILPAGYLQFCYLLATMNNAYSLFKCRCLQLNTTSVQFSHSVVSSSLWPRGLQHVRPPCPSPTPGVHTNSRPSSWWCHPAISSSLVPFSFCPQSLPASESFPMSQLFTWGGQSTGVSASASFLPKKSQGWSPLEWTSWISLQSKGLSRAFSNTTVQKHQFFGAQLSS